MFARSIAARAGESSALAIEAKRYSKSQEKPFPLTSESELTMVNPRLDGAFRARPGRQCGGQEGEGTEFHGEYVFMSICKDSSKSICGVQKRKKSQFLPENFGVSKEGVIFAPQNQTGGFI